MLLRKHVCETVSNVCVLTYNDPAHNVSLFQFYHSLFCFMTANLLVCLKCMFCYSFASFFLSSLF